MAATTISTHLDALKAGRVVTAPTPTPNPLAPAGRYVNAVYGYSINVPSGWLLSETSADRVVIYTPDREAAVSVLTFFVGAEYADAETYARRWRPTAPQGSVAFAIRSEGVIRRGAAVEGYEFVYSMIAADAVEWEGFAHWYIVGGLLFQVTMQAPRAFWADQACEAVDIALRLVGTSFEPPK